MLSLQETTVFISCTTLIKEVKLCVDASKHPPLDALLDNLVNHKIAAEEAVKHLQTLVGTPLVQQVQHSLKPDHILWPHLSLSLSALSPRPHLVHASHPSCDSFPGGYVREECKDGCAATRVA